jgi:hypothetical protein
MSGGRVAARPRNGRKTGGAGILPAVSGILPETNWMEFSGAFGCLPARCRQERARCPLYPFLSWFAPPVHRMAAPISHQARRANERAEL